MITTRNLSNGIGIVMEEMPAVQSIAIGFWVKTGAVDEVKEHAGISHFVEHMMFKGTEQRTARRIASDMERLGAQMNAFTGKEATCYYFKCVADNYKKAADIMIDMLEGSLFENTEMDRERLVICEEIKMGEDSPDDVAHDKMVEMIFDGTPMGNSITGTPESLSSIDHSVMKQYVGDQYTRNAIVISVAGKFDPDDICSFFEKKLNSLKAEKAERPEVKAEYVPKTLSTKKDVQQSHICLGTKGITLLDDRSYAMQLLNSILGGGMSSRLFQNIREQKGLAYSVFSSTGMFSGDGYFEIYAGVSHDNVAAAVQGIREELKQLDEKPVGEEELESARQQQISAYVFSQESTSARMVLNGKNWLLLNRTFLPEEVIGGYNNVTLDDLENVKKLITDFSQYTFSVVSDREIETDAILERS